LLIQFNPLNAELNPISHLLTLLGAHPIFHISRISVNIILLSTSGSSKWSLSPRFHHQNPVCTSPLLRAFYMMVLFILLDLITRIIFGEECRSWSSSLGSLFQRAG
jgi:hypothetical protein